MSHVRYTRFFFFASTVIFSSYVILGGLTVAQESQESQRGRSAALDPDRLLRSLPLVIALDTNSDGVISNSEIESATKSLRKIDKNKDGQLTVEELRPSFSGATRRLGRFSSNSDSAESSGAEPSGNERQNEMLTRFLKMDENSDGKLSSDEVPERFRVFIMRADENDDGFVTKDEFRAVLSRNERNDESGKNGIQGGAQGRMQQRGTEQFFARMFEQRDVNQDGKLSADEMPEQMSARLKQVDTDADGFVSRAEMKAMVSRLRGRSGGQPKARQATPGYESEDSNGNRPGGDLPRRPAVE